jgi:hypothetical protein
MASQRPANKARPPSKDSTYLRDVGSDTVWHTRGLQAHSRLRSPLPPAMRTPRRQLPPSKVPRMLAWALMLVMLAVFANALLHMMPR